MKSLYTRKNLEFVASIFTHVTLALVALTAVVLFIKVSAISALVAGAVGVVYACKSFSIRKDTIEYIVNNIVTAR